MFLFAATEAVFLFSKRLLPDLRPQLGQARAAPTAAAPWALFRDRSSGWGTVWMFCRLCRRASSPIRIPINCCAINRGRGQGTSFSIQDGEDRSRLDSVFCDPGRDPNVRISSRGRGATPRRASTLAGRISGPRWLGAILKPRFAPQAAGQK